MSDFETVRYQKKGSIAYITLNRPGVMNVYNTRMRDELYQVLSAIRDDNEIRASILTGAGEKAFCAGADLTEFLTAPTPMLARMVRWDRDVWGLFLSLPQPVIAALYGYVLGSGVEMALCCDLRIASDDTQFVLPEVNLGIIPAAGATQTLPRTIGMSLALEMLLTGRRIYAMEAYEAGLVNKVVPGEKLLETVEDIALRIAALNPTAIRHAKRALLEGQDLSLSDGLELERRLAASILCSSSGNG
jgi:enoyl-CoA hydratase/carnithine racemase